MSSIDDNADKIRYAAELGDEWTEVEPGIFVRVERDRRLQVVEAAAVSEDQRTLKGAS